MDAIGKRSRPLHPNARIELSNRERSIRLSEALLKCTFADDLWLRINSRCGCLIDEYEEDKIDWARLPEALDELHRYELPVGADEDVRLNLRNVIELVAAARERGLGVIVSI